MIPQKQGTFPQNRMRSPTRPMRFAILLLFALLKRKKRKNIRFFEENGKKEKDEGNTSSTILQGKMVPLPLSLTQGKAREKREENRSPRGGRMMKVRAIGESLLRFDSPIPQSLRASSLTEEAI